MVKSIWKLKGDRELSQAAGQVSELTALQDKLSVLQQHLLDFPVRGFCGLRCPSLDTRAIVRRFLKESGFLLGIVRTVEEKAKSPGSVLSVVY